MEFYLEESPSETSTVPASDIDYTMAELIIENLEVVEGEMRENKFCDDLVIELKSDSFVIL